ncbi:MAG: hypothetical protein HQ546_04965 [Planctomycetes bacterium]|nr:hypothetical protein [Planctomycetota bacterium]
MTCVTTKSLFFLVVVLIVAAGLAGCAKDPQVNVTPFVMKPCVARPAAPTEPAPDSVVAPCTRKYEEAMAGKTLLGQR